MDRRSFLKTSLGIPAAGALASPLASHGQNAPWSNGRRWRSFELTTRVELRAEGGAAEAWLPMPLAAHTDYFRTLGNSWTGNASEVRIERRPEYESVMLHARWSDTREPPVLELASTFMARDRALNPGASVDVSPADKTALRQYLKATELLPIDGIVRETALQATRGARNDLERARGIYEWIVENTFRDPKVRGCGWGDIRTMLETGNLGGKCGDLNALFVGMARALGIPARDVYGIRVAPSQWGYRSMSASGEVTRAQHCRAEFWLTGLGWIPVDPADVRKVVLEEPPGKLALADAKVKLAREKLFGAWEMNWCAFNYAHDVALPGSRHAPVPYLMYPAADTASGRKDSLDPDNFRYTIRAREVGV